MVIISSSKMKSIEKNKTHHKMSIIHRENNVTQYILVIIYTYLVCLLLQSPSSKLIAKGKDDVLEAYKIFIYEQEGQDKYIAVSLNVQ